MNKKEVAKVFDEEIEFLQKDLTGMYVFKPVDNDTTIGIANRINELMRVIDLLGLKNSKFYNYPRTLTLEESEEVDKALIAYNNK